MAKGPGKVNSGAGISEEDLARLTEELTNTAPERIETKKASTETEMELLKAQVAALIKVNQDQAKQLAALDEVDDEAEAANVSRASSKTRYAITIDEGNDANDTPDVFVQVNGRSYLIKRGSRVEVPPEVLEVLDHAVAEKHIPVNDERTGMPNGTITRSSRRFPYQNHGVVVDAAGARTER